MAHTSKKRILYLTAIVAWATCTTLFFLLWKEEPRAGVSEALTFNVTGAEISEIRTVNVTGTENFTIANAIVVCHPNWRGIRAASYQLGLPVYEAVDLMKEYTNITKFMCLQNADTVVVNGIPAGFTDFAANIRRDYPAFRVSLVYHGSFSQHFTTDEGRLLDDVIKSKDVWRFGFMKPGMAQAMKAAGYSQGADVYSLGNLKRPNPARFGKLRLIDGRFHVGIFAEHSWIKNTINQIAGACMLKGSVVHVSSMPEAAAPYIRRMCSDVTIVEHGFLKHLDLQLMLSSLDLSLHISLTECFPMLVLESISVGTPCLTSDTSVIYDSNTYLREMLVVSKHDDVTAIFKAITTIKENLALIELMLPSMLAKNNIFSRSTWKRFLDGELPAEENFEYVDKSYPLTHPTLLPGRLPLVPIGSPTGIPNFYLDKTSNSNLTVCFATYELGRVTAGGMGVFLDAIARELRKNGGRPVILADMSESQLHSWQQLCKAEGLDITVYHLQTVLLQILEKQDEYQFPKIPQELMENFIYLKKSVQFAQAISFVNSHERCDLIELFEYVGISYELLRDRRAYLGYDTDRTPIVLRAHGSIGIINISPSIVGGIQMWDKEITLIHLMELLCMNRADSVLVSLQSMKDLYARFYFLPDRNIQVFPPPLDLIVFHPLNFLQTRSHLQQYLIYGRLYPFKGTTTIIKAAVQWILEDNVTATFLFVGLNMYPNCANYACLYSLIPSAISYRFTFLPFMDKHDLPGITEHVRCTIFASVFETFNFAAYEMASLHFPAVIADIPAFRALYNVEDAFFFNPFSIDSLVAALRASFTDAQKIDRLAKLQIINPVNTEDALEHYKQLSSVLINHDSASASITTKVNMLFQAVVDTGTAPDVLPFY